MKKERLKLQIKYHIYYVHVVTLFGGGGGGMRGGTERSTYALRL